MVPSTNAKFRKFKTDFQKNKDWNKKAIDSVLDQKTGLKPTSKKTRIETRYFNFI